MSPESTPEAARLHAPGNFPRGQQGRRGRRFPSAPRAPRARGSGRAAGAAAAASSRPRLRRAASSLRPARPPGSLPSWQALAAAAAADGEGVRRPRGVGDEAREVSSGRSSVRPPARPLTLLPQHHGGAERLARARPASPAGGPGDSGGGDGPGGRDISTGPGSGGAGSPGPGPGSSCGSSLGPGSSGGRLAHLQGRVRASGGYRSVRRVLRGRSRPGAETGREWVRDAVFPACLHSRRQRGRLRGLPALTVILLYFLIFNLSLPSLSAAAAGGGGAADVTRTADELHAANFYLRDRRVGGAGTR